MSTTDLIPYSKNAKRHPAEQVRLIANSIREFGFQQPIVVDKHNVVIIGHGRLLAAKRLKIAEVPVVIADELTEDQIKALRLADNKVGESDKYYNKMKSGWGLNQYLPDIEDGWQVVEDSGFADADTAKVAEMIHMLIKTGHKKEALELLDCIEFVEV